MDSPLRLETYQTTARSVSQLARELRPEYAGLDDEELWQAERQRCYEAAHGRLTVAVE